VFLKSNVTTKSFGPLKNKFLPVQNAQENFQIKLLLNGTATLTLEKIILVVLFAGLIVNLLVLVVENLFVEPVSTVVKHFATRIAKISVEEKTFVDSVVAEPCYANLRARIFLVASSSVRIAADNLYVNSAEKNSSSVR